jgi:hypothetical protein
VLFLGVDGKKLNLQPIWITASHVILHQDKTVLVTTGVMYHVGAKDEEALPWVLPISLNIYYLKELENVERGEWFKIVSANVGRTMPALPR